MNADRDQRDKCKAAAAVGGPTACAAVQTAAEGACPADANCYYASIDEVDDVNNPEDYAKTRQYAAYPGKYLYPGAGVQDLTMSTSYPGKTTWSQQDCIDACQATAGCRAVAWRQTG